MHLRQGTHSLCEACFPTLLMLLMTLLGSLLSCKALGDLCVLQLHPVFWWLALIVVISLCWLLLEKTLFIAACPCVAGDCQSWLLNCSAFCKFLPTEEFLSNDGLCTVVRICFVPNGPKRPFPCVFCFPQQFVAFHLGLLPCLSYFSPSHLQSLRDRIQFWLSFFIQLPLTQMAFLFGCDF